MVILNLATVVPCVGSELVTMLLGSFAVHSTSLRRFTVLHFLLAAITSLLSLLHLTLVHRSTPSSSHHIAHDGTQALGSVIAYDIPAVLLMMLSYISTKAFEFIHPDN